MHFSLILGNCMVIQKCFIVFAEISKDVKTPYSIIYGTLQQLSLRKRTKILYFNFPNEYQINITLKVY